MLRNLDKLHPMWSYKIYREIVDKKKKKRIVKCPTCGSAEVKYDVKLHHYLCLRCGKSFKY